eukprot:3261151-Rhodomonas_salina.1
MPRCCRNNPQASNFDFKFPTAAAWRAELSSHLPLELETSGQSRLKLELSSTKTWNAISRGLTDLRENHVARLEEEHWHDEQPVPVAGPGPDSDHSADTYSLSMVTVGQQQPAAAAVVDVESPHSGWQPEAECWAAPGKTLGKLPVDSGQPLQPEPAGGCRSLRLRSSLGQ